MCQRDCDYATYPSQRPDFPSLSPYDLLRKSKKSYLQITFHLARTQRLGQHFNTLWNLENSRQIFAEYLQYFPYKYF